MNENYNDFLSLGSSLQGGEEKVEEVRLGLLGFRRDVEGLRGKVEGRRREVEALVDERKRITEKVQLGRRLLEVEERVEELEARLMVVSLSGDAKENEENSEVSDSDEESEKDTNGVSTARLKRHAQRFLYIQQLVERIGPEHLFLVKQEERILRLRQTVLLDLGNALKHVPSSSDDNKGTLMKILGIYRDLGESGEALKVLRERKR